MTRRDPRITVCVVCTANTCRSPMAEAYLVDACRRRGIDACVNVCSAGIIAGGGSISEYSHVVLDSEGVQAPPGQSCRLTAQMVDESDMIVTMTAAHKAAVEDGFPAARGKTQTLLSVIDSDADVSDPVGGSIREYQDCLDRMKPAIEALADWMAERCGGERPDQAARNRNRL